MTSMRRMVQLAALAFSLAGPLPASAQSQSLGDMIIAELRHQGYTQIDVGRTLLGRTRIVAESKDFHREIVFNPATGNILRDYWRKKDNATVTPTIIGPSDNSGGGSSSASSGGTSDNTSSGSGSDDHHDSASGTSSESSGSGSSSSEESSSSDSSSSSESSSDN